MAKYQYTAIDGKGKQHKGIIEAENEMDATALLKQKGWFPQGRLTLAKEEVKKKFDLMSLFQPRAVIGKKDLGTMTRQLATLLQAGLPLVRGLRTLERQAKGINPSLERVLADLASQVEGGATFSEALANHPKSFTKLYVSMVRAGEASGAMDVVLVRLAEFMEKAAKIAGKIKSAMMYPCVILTISFGIGAALMVTIVPKFSKMFDEMLPGEPLPAVTNFVVAISNILANHMLKALGVIVVLVIILRMLVKTKAGGFVYDFLALNMPPFKALVVRSVSARFCRTLGTLMASGVAVLQALQIVRDTAGNEVVSRAIMKVHDAVKEGEGMTRPLERTKVFPLMLCSMVEVGEETGALPDMLNRVANVYEDEVDQAVDGLTSMIEPLMIVFLAGMVGTIVVAMFAPMVKMIEKLGG